MTEYHYNNDELISKLTTVSSQLKTLADGYRDLTKVENQLSLFDMIGLQKHLSLINNPNLIKDPPDEYLVDGTKETGNYNDWCFNQYYIDVNIVTKGDRFTVSIKEANLLINNGKTYRFAVGIFDDTLDKQFGILRPSFGINVSGVIKCDNQLDQPYTGPVKFLIYCGDQGSCAGNKAVYKGLKLEVGDLATPL